MTDISKIAKVIIYSGMHVGVYYVYVTIFHHEKHQLNFLRSEDITVILQKYDTLKMWQK